MGTNLLSPPEQGQLVNVRQRQYLGGNMIRRE
jgi:hypothetical protein